MEEEVSSLCGPPSFIPGTPASLGLVCLSTGNLSSQVLPWAAFISICPRKPRFVEIESLFSLNSCSRGIPVCAVPAQTWVPIAQVPGLTATQEAESVFVPLGVLWP